MLLTQLNLQCIEELENLQDLRREAMKEALRQKKEEMRREQEKLTSSLTTALCKSEEAVLENKKWMDEIKVHLSFHTTVNCSNQITGWQFNRLFRSLVKSRAVDG